VGLGNPGRKFENTRHNAGRRALEKLTEELGAKLRDPKAKLRPGKPPARVAEASASGARLILAIPDTYMNESGRAVAALVRWFKIATDNVIVLHDDIDLGDGTLRIKKGGGSGGNHGINSITACLASQDFFRVRIGVGRPKSVEQEPADFVLAPMSKLDAETLADAERRAAEAVMVIIKEGLEPAMARFNGRP